MGLLKLLGWKRQKSFADLSPDIRAATHEVVAANLDAFRTVYWQYVVGNMEEAHAKLTKVLPVAQGDWVVTRSFLLAQVARRLQARALKELRRLGGDSRGFYATRLEALTIAWTPLQFADALCQEHHAERTRGLSAQDRALGAWTRKVTPHVARVLWDWVTGNIRDNVRVIQEEVDLDPKFSNALVGQVGGAYYYDMVREIVRGGQLEVAPEQFRHTILNPAGTKGPLRVR